MCGVGFGVLGSVNGLWCARYGVGRDSGGGVNAEEDREENEEKEKGRNG